MTNWMEYKNIEKIFNWYNKKKVVEYPEAEIYADGTPNITGRELLEEIYKRFEETGSAEYELSPFYAESGHAELYPYDLEERFFLDDKELSEEEAYNNGFDYVERTYIF